MRTYRIECPECGMGPYSSHNHDSEMDSFAWTVINRHGTSTNHPGPREEGLPTGEGWLFGCPTATDLRIWFDGLVEELCDLGYVLTIYETVAYALGRRQCSFVGEKIMEMPLDSLMMD